MRTSFRFGSALVVACASALLGGSVASAATPTNDSEAGAISVTGLPFVHEQDTTDATADGPRGCGNNASVFFRLEPTTGGRYQVDTVGSGYDTVLTVFLAGRRPPEILECNDDRFGLDAGVRFRGQAGVAYTIMVSACCGSGVDGIGGHLVLHVERVNAEPLKASIEITGGRTDPLSGDITVTGTMSCSERSIVYLEAAVRQLRDGMFIARVYLSGGLSCDPGAAPAWSVELQPESNIAFGPGPAAVRYFQRGATDGFSEAIQLATGDDTIAIT
ncbi:MAG: hypothetical protein U0V56_01855 [Actinomycetota bacterium]